MTKLPSERATAVVKERQGEYGHPADNYVRLANIWGGILGVQISWQEVVFCLIALKMSRELTNEHSDNLTDIAGYANVYEMIQERVNADPS